MNELEIILHQEGKEWIANTNLPGTPPIGRHKDWRIAVGQLMHRLVAEKATWGTFVHLPKWTVNRVTS